MCIKSKPQIKFFKLASVPFENSSEQVFHEKPYSQFFFSYFLLLSLERYREANMKMSESKFLHLFQSWVSFQSLTEFFFSSVLSVYSIGVLSIVWSVYIYIYIYIQGEDNTFKTFCVPQIFRLKKCDKNNSEIVITSECTRLQDIFGMISFKN